MLAKNEESHQCILIKQCDRKEIELAERLMALLELTGRHFNVQSDAFTPPALGNSSWVGQCIRECGISNGTCSDSCGLCSKTARKRCHMKVGGE